MPYSGQLIAGPARRSPVICEAGSLAWPAASFASDPTVRLRKLAEFVE